MCVRARARSLSLTFSLHTYLQASEQVQEATAQYAFAESGSGDARSGAHAVLAAYWMGRDAPPTWTALPKEHALQKVCGAAHSMLMQNPLFPSQPWYWGAAPGHIKEGEGNDGVELGGSGERGSGQAPWQAAETPASGGCKERVYNMRKLQQLVRQLVGAGLLDAAELLLTDLEYLTLKFEVGLANEVAEEYEALRMAKRARGQGASAFLDAAREFEAFIAQSRGVFARQPSLLFQAAANMQEDGPMSRGAALVLSLQRPHPPWLRWINAHDVFQYVSAHPHPH